MCEELLESLRTCRIVFVCAERAILYCTNTPRQSLAFILIHSVNTGLEQHLTSSMYDKVLSCLQRPLSVTQKHHDRQVAKGLQRLSVELDDAAVAFALPGAFHPAWQWSFVKFFDIAGNFGQWGPSPSLGAFGGSRCPRSCKVWSKTYLCGPDTHVTM